jgi:hypothetical protein
VHHGTLIAGQPVQQRALPDVRLADQCDPARPAGAGGDFGGLRQLLQDGVEQVGHAASVDGADRVRLPEPQRPQRGGLRLHLLVVDLVRRQEDRLTGALQFLRSGLVGRRRADDGVDHDDDRVGRAHRDGGLLGDQLLQALGVGFPAAGVLHDESPAQPVGVVGYPVPCHAGDVLDDGLASTEDAVHQRRLADVRAADHRDDGRRRELLLEVALRVLAEFPVALVFPGSIDVGHGLTPARCSTRSTRCATTCSSVISLVSTTIASSAARSGDTTRVESRWSRRWTSASTPA